MHQKDTEKKRKKIFTALVLLCFILKMAADGLNDSFVYVISVLHYLRLRPHSPVWYACFPGDWAWALCYETGHLTEEIMTISDIRDLFALTHHSGHHTGLIYC